MSEREQMPGEGLHPAVDPARWERAVSGIMALAGPELERRARASSPVFVLAHWRRPVLSAAATVALLASAAILARGSSEDGGSLALAGAEDLGSPVAAALVPEAVATWLMGGESGSVLELVQAMEEIP